MARLTRYEEANTALKGNLDRYLLAKRRRHVPYYDIASDLYTRYGVRVSFGTVRAWCLDLDGSDAP
jgi:hypothetical protein